MSPITPFLSEYIYQNMKNGLKEDCSMHAASIHFLQMPDFAEKLINEDIEKTVIRM